MRVAVSAAALAVIGLMLGMPVAIMLGWSPVRMAGSHAAGPGGQKTPAPPADSSKEPALSPSEPTRVTIVPKSRIG